MATQNETLRDRMEARAKDPVTPVAGPYGHPLHPLLVTVPIGAWVASLVFDIIARSANDPSAYALGAKALIGVGIVGALAAAVFGFLDLLTIPGRTKAQKTAITHMILNVTVLVLFVVNFAMRSSAKPSGGEIVLTVIALAMLAVSGWLGGRMTYRYGIRVARERDQLDAF
jgi:uncharacterized membrane protein